MDRIARRTTVLVGGLLLALAMFPACGGDSGDGGGGGAAADAECPIGAIDEAGGGPVEITFWHSMTRALEETLVTLTDQFNASQDDVVVSLVNQTGYNETLRAYRSAIAGGDLPDLVQMEDVAMQQMIDSQTVLPAQACVDADDYSLDFLPRVLEYYTVDDALWPMPWNVSTPVLYYDKGLFAAAGLDPEDPPATFEEVQEYSQQLVDSGAVSEAGLGLKLEPGYLEQWLALADEPYVNEDNGRAGRADEAVFDTELGVEVFAWMDEMVSSGLAITNPTEGPSGVDNLIGIRSKTHAMTLESSAALGTVQQVIESGEGGGAEVGVAPMYGPGDRSGGVVVDGGSLYIVNRSAPEKQEAAWRFLKYLNEPASMAQWAAGSGYIPITLASIEEPVIQDLWAAQPEFRVGYDQLLEGAESASSAGPLIGDYVGVKDAVAAGMVQLTAEGVDPEDALANAKQGADDAMQAYNERLGV